MGKTLLFGMMIAIPAIIIAGPVFSRTLKNIRAKPFKEFYNPKVFNDDEMPPMLASIGTALLPVILIGGAAFLNLFVQDNSLKEIIRFIGDPVVAMLISVLFASYSLGIARGKTIDEVMALVSKSVSSVTMILLIIGGAGAFKQVMVDSGVSAYIAQLMKNSPVSPLILAWLMATFLRVCIGSATVAALTTAGIMAPIISGASIHPELMVLSIGAGSLMLSQVNDVGFWMFKEYFSLSVKETLLSWTVMETIIGIMGLLGVLVLNSFL